MRFLTPPRVDLCDRPMPKGEDDVSYESRAKKRKYKAAVKKARRHRWRETARRWFLTLARKDTRCELCATLIHRRREIVYRHEPRAVRCLGCADRDPECSYRPSIRWERKQRVAQ